MPLINNEAEQGWSHLVNDVHGLFKKKDLKDIKLPVRNPEEDNTEAKRKRKSLLLEIFVISIITAIGLSIGYWIFNFILRLL